MKAWQILQEIRLLPSGTSWFLFLIYSVVICTWISVYLADLCAHTEIMTLNQQDMYIMSVTANHQPPHWCLLSQLDVPDRHPQCTWAPAMDPSHFQFNCTWLGAYPTPKLTWGQDQGDQGAGLKGGLYAWNVTDNLSVTLNRSMLSNGQTLRCMAQHLWFAQRDKNSCSFTLSKHVVVKWSSLQSWDVPLLNLLCTFQFRGHWDSCKSAAVLDTVLRHYFDWMGQFSWMTQNMTLLLLSVQVLSHLSSYLRILTPHVTSPDKWVSINQSIHQSDNSD